MEIIIWIVHQGISLVIHSCANFFPVDALKSRMIISYYLQVLLNLLCIYMFRKYLFRFSVKNVFTRKNLRFCLWGIISGIGMCLAHRLIFILFPQIGLDLLSQVGEGYIMSINNYQYSPAIFIYTVLLAPVTEEIFNRGIIFNTAHKRHGNIYAVVVSALLFAIGHYNFMQFISALCMGLLIGYFIVRTGNVYIGIIIHVANNMFSTISSMVLGEKSMEISYKSMLISSIAGVFILGSGICMTLYDTGSLSGRKHKR